MILTKNPQLITLADSNILELDFSTIFAEMRGNFEGEAHIKWVSGTAILVSSNGEDPDASSGYVSAAIVDLFVPIEKNINVKLKGANTYSCIITIFGK